MALDDTRFPLLSKDAPFPSAQFPHHQSARIRQQIASYVSASGRILEQLQVFGGFLSYHGIETSVLPFG